MEYIRTTKGSVKLHRDGYLYYKNKTSNNGNTLWECVNRRSGDGCKAKILLNENGELIREHRGHTHEVDPEKVSITRARAGMKRSANETVEKTQNIMTVNLDGLGEEALARMPNEETLRRDIRRNRKLNDVVVPDARYHLFDIPPIYMVNNLGNPFLQYDNNHEDRMLIFGTRQSLDFLSNSPHWFMDGTFKVSPPQFSQLYTVHGLSAGRNVVGVYALLPNKRLETYREMLTQVQHLTNGAIPDSIMIDFENSIIGAISDIYPLVPQRGCLFHLSKSVYRHVQQLGLQDMYLNDINFRTNIRMIPALSFVPIEDTVIAFNELAAHCGNIEQPVLDYFETTYVGELRRGRRLEPLFTHALWNMNTRVEDNLPRTNNDIEGWHNGFAGMFRHTHPPIWQFIDVLKQDSSFNHMKIAQVIAGAAPRPQKRIYREITLRIRNEILSRHTISTT